MELTSCPRIIIYDAECVFCARSIQLILKGKPDTSVKFISNRSANAGILLPESATPANGTTIIFIDDGNIYTESTAVLTIARHFTSRWRHLYYLIFVPKFLRDACYRLIARNRYAILGRTSTCRLFTADESEYFIN